jgi:hypothetical protein
MQSELNRLQDELGRLHLDDLPSTFGGPCIACPCCGTGITPDGWEPTYEQAENLRGWTLAQLIAVANLARWRRIDWADIMDLAATGPRPGIGGVLSAPTVLGVTIGEVFYGIEPDGYTHT